MEVPKSEMRKKTRKEDEQTLADLSPAHRSSQGECQLTELSRSVREHLDLGQDSPISVLDTLGR